MGFILFFFIRKPFRKRIHNNHETFARVKEETQLSVLNGERDSLTTTIQPHLLWASTATQRVRGGPCVTKEWPSKRDEVDRRMTASATVWRNFLPTFIILKLAIEKHISE